MLEIELDRVHQYERPPYKDWGFIRINHLQERDSYYGVGNDREINAHLATNETVEELLKFSFPEIRKFIHSFSFKNRVDFIPLNVEVILKDSFGQLVSFVKASFALNGEEWNKPYTIKEFSNELSGVVESDNNKYYDHFRDAEFALDGTGIIFYLNIAPYYWANVNEPARVLISIILEEIEKLVERTIVSIMSKLDKDSLTIAFGFPENIRTACKQYLVYFSQFLVDMGIEADTEIKEDARKTLFRVIPKSKEESLDRIRQALHIYLNAPASKDMNVHLADNTDIAIMQWQANIMHLKGQLMVAESVMQLKNATIQSLELSNYQLNALLKEKEALVEANKEEHVIKGVVSVKKYEGKGFSVNLPEILRRLKRKFK